MATPTPADAVAQIDQAADQIRTALANAVLVFELELALGEQARRALRARKSGTSIAPVPAWAPTLNEYNGLVGWQKAALRKAIDATIMRSLGRWPRWKAGYSVKPSVKNGKLKIQRMGGRRRLVVVTRESSRRPDELSVDVLGGKAPIDRLVLVGVLVGDSDRWLARVGMWRPARPEAGRVLVQVYDLAES